MSSAVRPAPASARGLWLFPIAILLALALNISALRGAWLNNLAYLRLDGLLNPAIHAGFLARGGQPEPWFEAAQQAAGQPRFETAYGLGLAWLVDGDDRQAIDALRSALAINPAHLGTYALLGDAYHGAANDGAAVAEWQSGQALPLLMARADARRQAGSLAEAAHWYQLATQVAPTSAEAFWQLALVQGALGQRQAAIGTLLVAVSLAPNSAPIRHALGLAYLRIGALSAAEGEFLRVLELEPDDFYTNLYLANLELALDHPDLAEAFARKATQLSPENPRTHYALANAWARRAQWPDAVDELRTALNLIAGWNHQSSLPISQDEVISYHLLLATAYTSTRQPARAVAEYKAVLVLDPSNASAMKKLQALPDAAQP
jgi:tetratricopeptide (TPR) repeat protein